MDHIVLAITRKAGTGGVKANRFLKSDGTHPTTKGERALGVTEYKEAEGRPVSVSVLGTKLVEAGAAISEGDELISDTAGRAIPKAGDTPFVMGEALTAAAKAGDMVELLICRYS